MNTAKSWEPAAWPQHNERSSAVGQIAPYSAPALSTCKTRPFESSNCRFTWGSVRRIARLYLLVVWNQIGFFLDTEKVLPEKNGTNDNRVAWASDVSEGQMRCVAVEDVGVAMSHEW